MKHTTKTFAEFFSASLIELDKILIEEKPDKILVLGDTNSGLLSILCRKRGIPIYHMEAGNRCYDASAPEEVNRKIIDSISFVNMPYTENSKQNLINEGFAKNRVFKTGNPLLEVMNTYKDKISKSNIMYDLQLFSGRFALSTIHRSENTENHENLSQIVKALNIISEDIKVILPLHPKTVDNIKSSGILISKDIIVTEPLGFLDFSWLEREASILISDSGTVPEEGCIYGIPSLIVRNSTERHELIECGASILTGVSTTSIVNAYHVTVHKRISWTPPSDYLHDNVSDVVTRIINGEYYI